MTSNSKKRAQLTARLIGGAAIVAASVGGVALASTASTVGIQNTRQDVTAQPAAGVTALGCTGPMIALGRDLTNTRAMWVAADPKLTVSASGASVRRDPVVISGVDGGASELFAADPVAGERQLIAAAGSATLADPDLTGFAAFACQPATMQSYIVGGDTMTGSSGVLTLTNPGEVTATVDIVVFGAAGPTLTPGSTGIVVPAATTVALSYPGIVGDESTPVLRIDSHGTPVLANLQSSLVRTLVTGGADVQSAVQAPSVVQTIPGIVITADDGRGSDMQKLRVLAPAASTTASVELTKVGVAEPAFTTTVDLVSGIASEVEVPNLAAGNYVATITATEPTVAAAWSTTGYDAGSDFSWAASAPHLDAGVVPFSVPAGKKPTLTIANPGDAPASVSVVTGENAAKVVELEPRSSVEVAVAAESSGSLTIESGEISASVSFASANATASFPLWPADAAAAPVTVSR